MAKSRKKHSDKLPPFVALTWDILNSQAYWHLPYAAAKALPYFLGKVKTTFSDPQKYISTFSFSYQEAKRYGFAPATFSKVIQKLICFGFIDPVDKGGLRGCGRSYNIFRLSRRWESYGKPGFQPLDWQAFQPRKSSFKM